MAITPISAQSTSTASLQNQEQQLLSQIKSLQSKDANGNAAQIKVLQQKYNTLLLQQQQQTQPTVSLQQSPVAAKVPASPQPEAAASQPQSAPSTPSASPADRGINIKA